MKTAILIDSGCDVSHELIQRFHMKVMHLHIIYPERDYVDGVDILPETIYQRFPGEIPATSTPSPQDVKDMAEEIKAEGYTHVLAFCISSGLSGTYNTVGSISFSSSKLLPSSSCIAAHTASIPAPKEILLVSSTKEVSSFSSPRMLPTVLYVPLNPLEIQNASTWV